MCSKVWQSIDLTSTGVVHCAFMYQHLIEEMETQVKRCETYKRYVEKLHESIPRPLRAFGTDKLENLLAWCSVVRTTPRGICLCLNNPWHTSDEIQLRSPPFY